MLPDYCTVLVLVLVLVRGRCAGSPFTLNVGGQPSGRVTERIDRQQQAVTQTSAVGSQCELNITMAGVEPQNIDASVTGPSGATQRCDLVDLGANRYSVKFVPREMGVHTVSLKHKGLPIPGLNNRHLLYDSVCERAGTVL